MWYRWYAYGAVISSATWWGEQILMRSLCSAQSCSRRISNLSKVSASGNDGAQFAHPYFAALEGFAPFVSLGCQRFIFSFLFWTQASTWCCSLHQRPLLHWYNLQTISAAAELFSLQWFAMLVVMHDGYAGKYHSSCDLSTHVDPMLLAQYLCLLHQQES